MFLFKLDIYTSPAGAVHFVPDNIQTSFRTFHIKLPLLGVEAALPVDTKADLHASSRIANNTVGASDSCHCLQSLLYITLYLKSICKTSLDNCVGRNSGVCHSKEG